jgi:hypothetical protein
MGRTVADLLASGCAVCGCELDVETAIVAIARLALVGDEPPKWSPGRVAFLCEPHAIEAANESPEPETGSFDAY